MSTETTPYGDYRAQPSRAVICPPWKVLDDGTVVDASERVVCVLGHPDDALDFEDVANGELILAAPAMATAPGSTPVTGTETP